MSATGIGPTLGCFMTAVRGAGVTVSCAGQNLLIPARVARPGAF